MKNKINDQLLEQGFFRFSEMSYEEYLPYQKKIECSDLTYAVLYAYDETYPYLVKKIGSGLVITGVDTKFEAFCVIIPLKDEELPFIYEEVATLFKRLHISMRLSTMSEKYMKLLADHPLTESVEFQEDRSDYVYEIEAYLDLQGGKNARKRRDLNKITGEFNNIRVETIRDFQAEKKTILKVMDKWCEGYDCEKCVYGCEKKVIEKILNSDLINKMYGAIMYIGDRAEMFAISQVIGDTCYLYFKKSAGKIGGESYYFEYEFLQPIRNVKYVNFAEDMGLPGLREYKRRRHPVKMIDKYDIRIKGVTAEKESGSLVRAKKEEEPFITALWQEAFGDSKEYIEKFLEANRNTDEEKDRVFLWKENGQNRTMLFALPVKIKENGTIKNARYLYAIATKKENRGNRYLKQMLPELKKVFGEDCVLFLVPEEGLISYYESLGFVKRQGLPGFTLEIEKNGTPEIAAASEKVTLQEITDVIYYNTLRNKALEGRAYAAWDAHEISWALHNIFMAQGKVYVVECDYGKYLLAGIRKGQTEGSCFQVIETTLPIPLLEEMKEELAEKLDCVKIVQKELFYMIEAEKAEGDFYLSFALDE